MSRRRLRLVCSDEDEDDGEPQPPPSLPEPQHHHQQPELIEIDEGEEAIDEIEMEIHHSTINIQTVTLNSSISRSNPNYHPKNPPEPIQLDISDDDDFVDVSEDLSPQAVNHSHPPLPPPDRLPVPPQPFQLFSSTGNVNNSTSGPVQAAEGPVASFLQKLGLRLRREWFDSCIRGLGSSVPGFGSLDDVSKAKLCFEQFLYSDMNYIGAGVLPENVQSKHLVDLAGPFVLQVDEIVNISAPLRGRYQNAPSGLKRCLKLSMTDGFQRVFGMEYRPIKDLEVLASVGMKVAVCNVHVRYGLLMLVPEAFEVLGGLVEELDAARQRLVDEVNKPPRGKRTRNGVVPPLAARATHAAWPVDDGNISRQSDNSISQATPFQAHAQGSVSRVATPVQPDGSVSRNATAFPTHAQNPVSQVTTALPPDGSVSQTTTPFHAHAQESVSQVRTPILPDGSGSQTTTPLQARSQESLSRVATPNLPHDQGAALDDFTRARATEESSSLPMNRDDSIPNPSSAAAFDVEEIHMADVNHPLILSGDREVPFMYLASLSAKWAAMRDKSPSIQGKVKCFLTGVKGFHYKQRNRFELRVYIDDGSLISEILIDHNVVQKGIGHSPKEVTDALVSSDLNRVNYMKETLRQFQSFLANFEGIMLIEMNDVSAVPVAVEINQGCPASDAWLLLSRLKSPVGDQISHD